MWTVLANTGRPAPPHLRPGRASTGLRTLAILLTPPPVRKHFASLDGLRGVAALAVVGSHFENLSGFELYLQQAGVAVDFFFVLSGFVIAQAYEQRLLTDMTWRRYMGIRLARLYPAIFGGVLAGLIVAGVAGEPLSVWLGLQFLLLPVLQGAAVHGGELFPLNGPQWSLFWELAINGVHAAVVRWLTTPVLIAVIAVAAGALIWTSLLFGSLDVGWSRANLMGALPRVVYSFGVGLLIFRAHTRGFTPPKVPYVIIVIGLIVCMFRAFPDLGGFAIRDLVVVLVILPALVTLAIASPLSARAERWAIFLGALSYPLYAIHVPLLRAFNVIVDTLPDDAQTPAWWVSLILTLGLAVLFERFYDAPIRRWISSRRRVSQDPARV